LIFVLALIISLWCNSIVCWYFIYFISLWLCICGCTCISNISL